jgi:hypothetical protein
VRSVEKTGGDPVANFSNEKITGDTAIVEMKAPGQTVTALLVKEGSEWKMALDKMFPNQRIFGSPSPAGNPAQAPSSS